MSAIEDKYKDLRKKGLNLGAAKGPESDIGYGGRVRIYEQGHIYWHLNTGAHEVHGGILTKYLTLGGPGLNPATGKRELGFPRFDVYRSLDGYCPRSEFEWGIISWTPGFNGGAVVTGNSYKYWLLLQLESGPLGHPLSETLQHGEGQAVFFQGGVVYDGPETGGVPIRCMWNLPLIGQPHIGAPDKRIMQITNAISFKPLQSLQSLIYQNQLLRQVLTQLLDGRFALRSVEEKNGTIVPLKAILTGAKSGANESWWTLRSQAKSSFTDRTLYDIVLLLQNGPVVVSPHSVYLKKSRL